MKRADIWSFGGGVQSIAMLILIMQGRLRKPERVIMANTGREREAVWNYLDKIAIPAMKSVDMDLEIVPHSYATVDILSHKGLMLLPVFFNNDGNIGKLSTYCSSEWKKFPVRRYLREAGYGPKKPILNWFGMSLDEVQRLRTPDKKWIKHWYPLCQEDSIKLRRHECRLLIERHGWPQPPSSACWMCPNRDDPTWQQMKDNEPDDFAKAVRLESVLNGAGWGDIYFHGDCVALSEVDFSKVKKMSLFDECAYSCWT